LNREARGKKDGSRILIFEISDLKESEFETLDYRFEI
jgi:hypothetical protein